MPFSGLTESDTSFMAEVFKHSIKLDVEWDKVAAVKGLKNAKCAQSRFYKIQAKFRLTEIEGNGPSRKRKAVENPDKSDDAARGGERYETIKRIKTSPQPELTNTKAEHHRGSYESHVKVEHSEDGESQLRNGNNKSGDMRIKIEED